MVFSVTGIYRKWKQFVETVAQNPTFVEVPGEVGVVEDVCTGPPDPNDPNQEPTCLIVSTGQAVTMFDWTNAADDTLLVTNPPGLERTYKGAMFTLTKNFRHNWQGVASYVYSKTTGTIDNVGFDGASDSGGQDAGPSPFLDTPNSKINWDGRVTHDPTHQLKLQGTYVFDRPNLWLSANWTYYTGDTYTKKSECLLVDDDADPNTPAVCYDFTQSSVIAKVRYFAEPRGSRRLPGYNEVNARLEWKPTIGKNGRFGVILDVFNLLNHTQVTERRDRDDGFFNEPTSFNVGRNIRVGARYEF
jgi:hypothetical protein